METPEQILVKCLRREASCGRDRNNDAADMIERLVRERDEALDRAQELQDEREETVKSFESECWNALRSLLDECNFDWRDALDGGVTAEEAREHISTTLSEMNDGETRQRRRAEDAEAENKKLRAQLDEAEAQLVEAAYIMEPFADTYNGLCELALLHAVNTDVEIKHLRAARDFLNCQKEGESNE